MAFSLSRSNCPYIWGRLFQALRLVAARYSGDWRRIKKLRLSRNLLRKGNRNLRRVPRRKRQELLFLSRWRLSRHILRYRPLFAKGYNDLILRSYDELSAWQNYLHDNPRRLLMKRARPEWLRPFFGLQIGQHSFSGIGNRALLTTAKRKAVRVSRRLSDEEIAREVGGIWKRLARVLCSFRLPSHLAKSV